MITGNIWPIATPPLSSKKLGFEIKTGPTGTNVADVSIALITNPDKPDRKIAIIFGGEATVKVAVPEGQKPGYGGRNTHLVLLAAQKLDERQIKMNS